jgi:Uma2 family endonuclease
MNNVSLQNVIEMPNAFLFVEQVNKYLADEQKKRRHYYSIIDENKKMEFINGEIFFQSPVKLQHNSATKLLCGLLNAFVIKHQFGFVGVEKIMISLTRNDYEPDICFFGSDKSKLFNKKQMQFPAPDFVVEVLSDSTAKNDRETKFQDYAAHGVQEYWIIDADKEIVEQYILTEQNYELYRKSNNGNIESVVLQGFTIPIRAVFDEKINIEILSKILS